MGIEIACDAGMWSAVGPDFNSMKGRDVLVWSVVL